MKKYILIFVMGILFMFLIPLLNLPEEKNANEFKGSDISVYNHITGGIENMPLEEYVCKVLSKEMPSSFETEALKAQAVAIRTYMLRKASAELEEHHGAMVCTDSSHCMAYMSDEEAKSRWGDNYQNIKEIYINAADATAGEILKYDDDYALTAFHAISSGKTENSEEVWGSDVGYLKSTDSSFDKEVEGYQTEVRVNYNEFINKIGAQSYNNFCDNITRTSVGSVKNITVCGVPMTGNQLRDLFSLRSANFEIREEDEQVVFMVYGYGHGVGMSQYGANSLAKNGYDYKLILNHYYNGTILAKQ